MDKAAAQAGIRFGLGTGAGFDAGLGPAALKAELAGGDPGLASGQFDGLPTGQQAADALRADAVARRAAALAGQALAAAQPMQGREMFRADGAAQVGWAVGAQAAFRERLVWFWANHFSVNAAQNQAGIFIGPMLREAIRPHVTGKFVDMVLAVERHPAMLRYLQNDVSMGPNSPAGLRTGRGLNENLGRECMELHTVGLGANYSQADVTSMAKILTGWSIGRQDEGDATGFIYRPRAHEPGPQVVLGRSFDGGEQAGIDALTFLATYPTTYQRLAQKLVTHFVADAPPPGAVARVAGVLRDTGGDLGAAAAAVVDLPAAWVAGRKLKTPFEYMISVLRAAPPLAGQPAVNYAGVLNQLGQPLWLAPQPNGWSDQAADWAGSDAVMARIDWAYGYAGRLQADGVQPGDVAAAALGPLLRPATATAMAGAASPREALTLLFAAPEFQRR